MCIMALFAFFGGIVRELRATSVKKKEMVDYLIEGLVGAFTGVVMASLMMDYIQETHLLFGIAGLSGYFGPIMLDVLKDPVIALVCRITGMQQTKKS